MGREQPPRSPSCLAQPRRQNIFWKKKLIHRVTLGSSLCSAPSLPTSSGSFSSQHGVRVHPVLPHFSHPSAGLAKRRPFSGWSETLSKGVGWE